MGIGCTSCSAIPPTMQQSDRTAPPQTLVEPPGHLVRQADRSDISPAALQLLAAEQNAARS
jgi:hypothetical protein